MAGLLNEAAKLHRIMPDDYDGPARPAVYDGTLRGCILALREMPEGERSGHYAQLETGPRLSVEELERVAVNEGG